MDMWSRERFVLGECARTVDGAVVFVDIFSGRLLRTPIDRPLAEQTLFTLPVPLGAVAPVATGQGCWIAAAGHGIALVDTTGELTWLAEFEPAGGVRMRMNDGNCDPTGRFWAGSMAYDARAGAGALYRVDGDGNVTRVLTGISIPNGPAFSLGGTVLYFTDSATRRIDAYPLDPATGTLGAPRTFARIRSGTPDPDGGLDRVVAVPATQPTSVSLAPGPSGTRLVVTTARYGLAEPADEAGRVLLSDVDILVGPTNPYRPSPYPRPRVSARGCTHHNIDHHSNDGGVPCTNSEALP